MERKLPHDVVGDPISQPDPIQQPNTAAQIGRNRSLNLNPETPVHLKSSNPLAGKSVEGSCIHHWDIPTNGKEAIGKCRICGAERIFSNMPPEAKATLRTYRRRRSNRIRVENPRDQLDGKNLLESPELDLGAQL